MIYETPKCELVKIEEVDIICTSDHNDSPFVDLDGDSPLSIG